GARAQKSHVTDPGQAARASDGVAGKVSKDLGGAVRAARRPPRRAEGPRESTTETQTNQTMRRATMSKTGTLTVTARGDREIVMTRTFNAPRRLVWEAYTKPELLKRWLLGPDGWYFIQCDVALRIGGKYRYVWKNDEKNQTLGLGGEYREISAPAKLVCTEKFDDFPGEAVS